MISTATWSTRSSSRACAACSLDLPVIDLEQGDLLHVIYDISERTQIPGKRHLYRDGSGQVRVNPGRHPADAEHPR